ncbi:MAG: ABC transporter ATP-binding protein [Oscillospiraceae bacterium]|nr:ABC transporter ATP-binding protein [Oscillospiraceae bacterium]
MSKAKEAVIDIQAKAVRYKSQAEPTLFDISIKIFKGEKILIAGKSGSGKSTLVHMINGLIPHAIAAVVDGDVIVCSLDVGRSGLTEVSKRVGTVLQDPDGQFVGLSVGEDIAFALENDCVPMAAMHERVLGAARRVHMENMLDNSPHELSGGQKQRATIAGVMVDDVDVLLFDEPLANLDPATGKYAIELIDEIHKITGKTIIIIEHRIEDVLHRSIDRVILVEDGRVVSQSAPAELLLSGRLRAGGIREPLYLTALRLAGITRQGMGGRARVEVKCADSGRVEVKCADSDRVEVKCAERGRAGEAEIADKLDCFDNIDAISGIENIDTLDVAPFKKRIGAWFGARDIVEDTSAAAELLRVEAIRQQYDNGTEAVKGASFVINRGEAVALLGRNGVGKSTLAAVICGMEPSASGTIYYKGADFAPLSIAERSKHIGFVMQDPNHMISKPMIYDEVALGLRARGVAEEEARERVFETLRICGLYPMRNWPISALSFGQKKRVTVAAVLVLGCEMLILDEPTAGQDYAHYTEIMEFLLRLKDTSGIALLFITHDMHLAIEYTDRAIVMTEGEIIADRPTAAVFSDLGVIDRANLKRTSLYELAIKAGLPPEPFIRRFIQDERGMRQ